MSTSYEIIYFGIHGRAEPIRLLFALAGVSFTDTAVTREEWKGLKGTMPLFQLPVLVERSEAGERRIPQSQAILRHLARSFGLYGNDEDERLRADVLAETCVDVSAALSALVYGPNKDNPEAVAKYWAETWRTGVAKLDALLAAAPSSAAGLFVCSHPTFADVVAFQVLHTHLVHRPTCLDPAPALRRFHDRMAALPQWQAYLASRRKHEAAPS
ncbi:MAG: glutathione S-transferase family protein [Deltaproteobacteria bacterium]|nr:glutathione S-transferase family protein [Deltaproteobacteria bacterium]